MQALITLVSLGQDCLHLRHAWIVAVGQLASQPVTWRHVLLMEHNAAVESIHSRVMCLHHRCFATFAYGTICSILIEVLSMLTSVALSSLLISSAKYPFTPH